VQPSKLLLRKKLRAGARLRAIPLGGDKLQIPGGLIRDFYFGRFCSPPSVVVRLTQQSQAALVFDLA